MGLLITEQRLIAASHENRWRGWTHRPISVLEHSVVGATLCVDIGRPDGVVPFLLHDLHETEFCGDVPTPDKAAYLGVDYHTAVVEFDTRLAHEAGLMGAAALRTDLVEQIDHVMKVAEYIALCTRDIPELNHEPVTGAVEHVQVALDRGSHMPTRFWVTEFWRLYNAHVAV